MLNLLIFITFSSLVLLTTSTNFTFPDNFDTILNILDFTPESGWAVKKGDFVLVKVDSTKNKMRLDFGKADFEEYKILFTQKWVMDYSQGKSLKYD